MCADDYEGGKHKDEERIKGSSKCTCFWLFEAKWDVLCSSSHFSDAAANTPCLSAPVCVHVCVFILTVLSPNMCRAVSRSGAQ